jgi:hypothetical protein
MMTDLMEFESRLLQGLTAANAIHHVVDFMAHVSTIHDALEASFASLEPTELLSMNNISTTMQQQVHVSVERGATAPASHAAAGNQTTNEPVVDDTVDLTSALITELTEASLSSTSSAMDTILHPSYNDSYTSLRSFLEKPHDTYSGPEGLL